MHAYIHSLSNTPTRNRTPRHACCFDSWWHWRIHPGATCFNMLLWIKTPFLSVLDYLCIFSGSNVALKVVAMQHILTLWAWLTMTIIWPFRWPIATQLGTKPLLHCRNHVCFSQAGMERNKFGHQIQRQTWFSHMVFPYGFPLVFLTYGPPHVRCFSCGSAVLNADFGQQPAPLLALKLGRHHLSESQGS